MPATPVAARTRSRRSTERIDPLSFTAGRGCAVPTQKSRIPTRKRTTRQGMAAPSPKAGMKRKAAEEGDGRKRARQDGEAVGADGAIPVSAPHVAAAPTTLPLPTANLPPSTPKGTHAQAPPTPVRDLLRPNATPAPIVLRPPTPPREAERSARNGYPAWARSPLPPRTLPARAFATPQPKAKSIRAPMPNTAGPSRMIPSLGPVQPCLKSFFAPLPPRAAVERPAVLDEVSSLSVTAFEEAAPSNNGMDVDTSQSIQASRDPLEPATQSTVDVDMQGGEDSTTPMGTPPALQSVVPVTAQERGISMAAVSAPIAESEMPSVAALLETTTPAKVTAGEGNPPLPATTPAAASAPPPEPLSRPRRPPTVASSLPVSRPSSLPTNATDAPTALPRRVPSYPSGLGSGPLNRPTNRVVSNPVMPPRAISNPVPPTGSLSVDPMPSRSVSDPLRPPPNVTMSARKVSAGTSRNLSVLNDALAKLSASTSSSRARQAAPITATPRATPVPPTPSTSTPSARPRNLRTGPLANIPLRGVNTPAAKQPLGKGKENANADKENSDAKKLDDTTGSEKKPKAYSRSFAALMAAQKGGTFLNGVVAYVDVRNEDGDDTGATFVDMLRSCGARVVTRPTESCTHFVYKSGKPATAAFWRKLDPEARPFVVGLRWVTRTLEAGRRASEADHKVDFADDDVFQKRRKSMEPKMGVTPVRVAVPRLQTIPAGRTPVGRTPARVGHAYAPKIGSPLKRGYSSRDI